MDTCWWADHLVEDANYVQYGVEENHDVHIITPVQVVHVRMEQFVQTYRIIINVHVLMVGLVKTAMLIYSHQL